MKKTNPAEADVRVLIDRQLRDKKWDDEQVSREGARYESQNHALGRKKPDYVLYGKDSTHPLAVIEAKRPGKDLQAAITQALSYAEKLNCPTVFASDGDVVRTAHLGDRRPLSFNGEIVREFLSERMLQNFRLRSAWFRGEVVQNSRDLISIFNAAGKLLREEGVVNIDAFTEFSHVLFFKIVSEIGDSENGADIPAHWRDIEDKTGTRLMAAYREGIHNLGVKYPDVFSEPQIRRPQTLERLVERLKKFSFIDVDADVKGEAYEYFLRRYNRQKSDLAQYFTPRHIVQAMVSLCNPQFGERVYDPFCGTGGMLIQAFKHIRKNLPEGDSDERMRQLREESVYGADISRSAHTAKMNMILAGDGHSNIHRKDSLSESARGQFEVVITNIPFGRDEAACIYHCMDAVKGRRGGRICMIVPERIIDSPQSECRKIREMLLSEWEIRRIVSLPREVFRGFTSAKTSIIYAFWKGGSKRTDKIPYFVVENDGYTLDKKRDPLPGLNDLDRLLEDRNENRLCLELAVTPPVFVIKPEAVPLLVSKIPTVPLDDLVVVKRRVINITPDMKCREPTFSGKEHKILLKEERWGYNVGVTKRQKILPGDLVFGRLHTQNGLFALSDAEYHGTDTQLVCAIDEGKVDRDYLFWVLDMVVPTLSMVDTTGRETYRAEEILALQIPLPPLARQQEIVAKVKDGREAMKQAKQDFEKAHDKMFRQLFGDTS